MKSQIEFKMFDIKDAEFVCMDAIDDNAQYDYRQWAEYYSKYGIGITGTYKGQVVGFAGFRPTRNHRAEAWAVFKKLENEFPTLELIKYYEMVMNVLKSMLSLFFSNFGLSMIYAKSRIEFRKSQRLLEKLGFEKLDRNYNGYYYYRLRRT